MVLCKKGDDITPFDGTFWKSPVFSSFSILAMSQFYVFILIYSQYGIISRLIMLLILFLGATEIFIYMQPYSTTTFLCPS